MPSSAPPATPMSCVLTGAMVRRAAVSRAPSDAGPFIHSRIRQPIGVRVSIRAATCSNATRPSSWTRSRRPGVRAAEGRIPHPVVAQQLLHEQSGVRSHADWRRREPWPTRARRAGPGIRRRYCVANANRLPKFFDDVPSAVRRGRHSRPAQDCRAPRRRCNATQSIRWAG
jgi:hypothetical protein